jgi:indole-3-glycerol phosphate synthase
LTDTLEQILANTIDRLPDLRRLEADLRSAADAAPEAAAWDGAFGGEAVAVIAEVKRRSPSAGVIAPDLDPARLAASYQAGGAKGISVLTNERFFGGTMQDLEAVQRMVAIPVLRKDFILDPVQLYEAKAAGASAVLLIVRALNLVQLEELSALAAELGLGALVEVHDEKELEVAMRLSPACVGVNSRDLETFQINVSAMQDVLRSIPKEVVAVAESGMEQREDVELVASWGADAVLVGTALAGSAEPSEAVRTMTGVKRHDRG